MKAKTHRFKQKIPLSYLNLFYTGDIVEVLNADFGKIKYHVKVLITDKCINYNLDYNKIKDDHKYWNAIQYIIPYGIDEMYSDIEVRLYKRPLKNWIKYFLSKLIGYYIP